MTVFRFCSDTAEGYAKGVPMGGDLTNAPQGKAPTFLAAALKDAIGANLDRIQIVKGWVGVICPERFSCWARLTELEQSNTTSASAWFSLAFIVFTPQAIA